MQQIISKYIKSTIFVALSFTTLNANEILSPTQLEILKLTSQQALDDSKKIKIDWINPITYTYTYKKDERLGTSRVSVISINQPIFRSGGIYSAIKYASNLKESSDIAIELQKKALVKRALNIVLNIQKLNLQIYKQKLLIANAIIDLKIKKESVFNGLLDISFLNNALISKNQKKSTLLDLEYNKESLINSFDNLSNVDFKNIKVPIFKQIDEEMFIKNNINLQKGMIDIQAKKHQKWMTTARYLPTINVNYNYTKNHTLRDKNTFYGFNVVVPLDFKGYYDSGSAKVSYLKDQKKYELLNIEENNFFKTANLKLAMLDKKILLTKQNIKAFDQLVGQTKELADVGMKTKQDIKILKNSQNGEKLNLKILSIDKQIEFLEIYSRINLK